MPSTSTEPAAPEKSPAPQPNRLAAAIRSLSWKTWAAFGVVLIGIGLFVTFTGNAARLHLICQHNVRSGELNVWADDQLVYSGKLSGSSKKKFGIFGGKTQGSFAQTVKVPDGHHNLRVRIFGEGYDQSRTIPIDFSADTEATVSINALTRNLQVNWRDTRFAASAANTPWYAKYAKALFFTIFGSIISALMGMVVRDVIEKLRKPKQQSVAGNP